MININLFERLPGYSYDRRIDRAIAFNLETNSAVPLMSNILSVSNTTNVVSLEMQDPDTVLTELRFLLGDEQRRPGFAIRTGERFATALYRVNMNEGRTRTVEEAQNNLFQRVIDGDGNSLAYVFYEEETGRFQLRREWTRRAVLFEGVYRADLPSVMGLLSDGAEVAVQFPEGELRGVKAIHLETGEMRTVSDDLLLGRIRERATNALVGFRYTLDGLPKQEFIDERLTAAMATLEGVFPDGRVEVDSFSSDRERIVFRVLEPGLPESVYLFDRAAGQVLPLVDTFTDLVGASLGATRYIRYEAADGLEIEAVLTLPAGASDEDGPFPLVLLPHGGPQAYDDLTFDWWTQAYASLGYAVLRPNYRGSAGYGQAFIEAGYDEFGGLMIEDMLDGARHLQAEGVAKPGGYCVAGASYGGYAALMAALRAPDEVACVVAVSPVTDPVSMLSDANEGARATVEYWERYIGSRFNSRETSAQITPLDHAGEFSTPILVMHGDEDTTVPYRQSVVFAEAMQGDADFSFIPLEGEDHYLSRLDSRLRILQESAALLDATLGAE